MEEDDQDRNDSIEYPIDPIPEPPIQAEVKKPVWVTEVQGLGEHRLHASIEELAEKLYQQCVAEDYFCDSVTQITPRGTRNTVSTEGKHEWYTCCDGGALT